MMWQVGDLVRIKSADHRPELVGLQGFVIKIIGEDSPEPIYVIAPPSNPDRPVGTLGRDLVMGDAISAIGDIVRMVA